ncbi:hypothetical protein Ddye_000797 [Dipteronia dyeriana]|uniref:Reverse transcriptase n=1 Tax=Dipteronia dyeriana TaxID=168575 RepID=A0AAD9XN00_9ROSI|nr:hypothetical protein Ddye_000797 [Dipteronia dyeriana]
MGMECEDTGGPLMDLVYMNNHSDVDRVDVSMDMDKVLSVNIIGPHSNSLDNGILVDHNKGVVGKLPWPKSGKWKKWTPDGVKCVNGVEPEGSTQAFQVFLSFKEAHSPDLFFVMETIRVKLGFAGKLVVDYDGRSGGICLLWTDSVDVSLLSYSISHIDVQLSSHLSVPWRFTGFYDHPEAYQRHHSWTFLHWLNCMDALLWVCTGDLNEIIDAVEKEGGNPRVSSQLNSLVMLWMPGHHHRFHFEECWADLCECSVVIENNWDDLYGGSNISSVVMNINRCTKQHVKGAEKMTNFRPISLCNMVYKIVTKALANWFRKVFDYVISETQSPFISDRLILDNAILGFECMHALKRRKRVCVVQ